MYFILKSNLFISLCAVGLSLETSVILSVPFQSVWLYTFIFFSTLFSYNLYYIKSKEVVKYRILTLIGFSGSVLSLFYLKEIPYFYLALISALSTLYLIPIFIPFRKANLFTVQKLLILILVWVLITFLFPIQHLEFTYWHTLLLVYRVVLMSHLCLLFFIKDEGNPAFKRIAISSCSVLSGSQFLLCILIAFTHHYQLAFIYFLCTIATLILSLRFNTQSKSTLHYLFFVDGIMLLQSIFVVLNFLFAL